MFAGVPGKATLVNNEATQTGPVSTDPFGGRRGNDIGPKFKGFAQRRGGKGGIHNEGQSQGVGLVGNFFQIKNGQTGIGDGFTKKGPGLVVGRPRKVAWIFAVDKVDGDPHGGQNVVKHGVRATVQLVGRYDIVPLLGQIENGIKNGIGARGRGQTRQGMSPLEECVPRFQHVRGGIHEARINVAQFLEGEEIGGVLGIAKDKGRGTVEGDAPGCTLTQPVRGLLVGGVSTVQGNGIKTGRRGSVNGLFLNEFRIIAVLGLFRDIGRTFRRIFHHHSLWLGRRGSSCSTRIGSSRSLHGRLVLSCLEGFVRVSWISSNSETMKLNGQVCGDGFFWIWIWMDPLWCMVWYGTDGSNSQSTRDRD
eukprot:scaffold1221_cov207-Amphora_coffeaeformis.AAC.60